jgi:hypothetical protein
VSLQRDATDPPPAELNVLDFPEANADMENTAALIANLDLILTVDTSIAHLAGALGKPVWTMLPCAPDWRWMEERDDSPWYPAMRLFRVPARAQWKPLLETIALQLKRFIG